MKAGHRPGLFVVRRLRPIGAAMTKSKCDSHIHVMHSHAASLFLDDFASPILLLQHGEWRAAALLLELFSTFFSTSALLQQ
jgi:hypothetical protein